MKEILDFYSKEITSSKILETVGSSSEKYFLVSAHREENVDLINVKDFLDSLNLISEKSKAFKFQLIQEQRIGLIS